MPGVIRTVALAAACSAAAAAPAAAAPSWLPSTNLSLGATGSPSNSVVASDAAGESFASWNLTDGTNVRVQGAAHAPGQPWSAPTNLSDPGQNAGAPSLSLSSTGLGAIAWTRSDGSKLRVQVSRRAPGGGFGAATTISSSAVDASSPVVAVDAAGDVLVVWEDSTNLVAHARRYTASTDTWGAIADIASAPMNQSIASLTVAINPAGFAWAAWLFDTDNTLATHYEVQTRAQDALGNWLMMTPVSSTPPGWESGKPELSVGPPVGTGLGVTLVWFQYSLSSGMYVNGIVFESTGSADVWQPAQMLSDQNLLSDSPQVATSPTGEVTVAWTEQLSDSIKVVTRPAVGSFPAAGDTTIIVPQDKTISSGFNVVPFTSVRVAAGPKGTVVSFARTDGTNYLAEAVFRPAGAPWPNPAVTPPTNLSAPGTDIGLTDGPSLAVDGLGNAVASWTRGSVIQSSPFDASPPAFTAVNVPATGTTGQPVGLSATTLDTWSGLASGQPGWNFGDNNLGVGPSVSHIYAAPGTYTVTVGASDAVGNVAAPVTRQIVISTPIPPVDKPLPKTLTVKKPRLKAAWKANRLVGTVSVSGTVGASTTLTISIRRHGTKKKSLSSRFAAKPGTWSRTLKLPSGLAPGRFDVLVSGSGVTSTQTSFILTAPKTGLVRRAFGTGPRRGPDATSLVQTDELWAHVVFGTLPRRGLKITTQWILPSGRALPANTRPHKSLVEAQVKSLDGSSLPPGRWRCIIRVGGVVVTTLTMHVE